MAFEYGFGAKKPKNGKEKNIFHDFNIQEKRIKERAKYLYRSFKEMYNIGSNNNFHYIVGDIKFKNIYNRLWKYSHQYTAQGIHVIFGIKYSKGIPNDSLKIIFHPMYYVFYQNNYKATIFYDNSKNIQIEYFIKKTCFIEEFDKCVVEKRCRNTHCYISNLIATDKLKKRDGIIYGKKYNIKSIISRSEQRLIVTYHENISSNYICVLIDDKHRFHFINDVFHCIYDLESDNVIVNRI